MVLGKQPLNLPCCQIKTPLKKLQKNYNTMLIYVCLMISCYVILQLFVLPYQEFFSYVKYLNLLFLITNIFFLMASFRDPGYVAKTPNLKFYKLVERCEPNSLCPNCETVYTRDSRHCYICNKCINKFDHHCQWINNCVGSNNHMVFYLYILTLLIYFCILITMCFINIQKQLTRKDLENGQKYNLLGFGQYNKAQELQFPSSIFNVNRWHFLEKN